MRTIAAALAIGGLTFWGLTFWALGAQPALAQTATPPAEPFRAIYITGFAGSAPQWEEPSGSVIRRAAATGDITTWLRETDAPIALWRQGDQPGSASFVLDVSADGRASACTIEPRRVAAGPEWAASLCPILLERARLLPALKLDGSRAADKFIVSIAFQVTRFRQPDNAPLIRSQGLSPAPPPPSDFNPQLKSWPPSSYWVRAVATAPAFKLAPEAPGGAALTGPVTGLVVADPKSGDLPCRVVRSSGDPALDEQACNYAVKKLKPKWANMVRIPVRRYPLLLAPAGKAFRALQPRADAARNLQIDPATYQAAAAAWQTRSAGAHRVAVAGPVDPSGQPSGCRIAETSGNDAADLAACRLFLDTVRYAPATDVFGQPRAGWDYLKFNFTVPAG